MCVLPPCVVGRDRTGDSCNNNKLEVCVENLVFLIDEN